MKMQWILGAAVAFSLTGFAQAVNLRPGQYEMVSQIVMKDRPTKLPPRKDVVCITTEDLRDITTKLVQNNGASGCTLTEKTPTSGGLKFTRECSKTAGVTITQVGDLTFTSLESYHEVVKMSTKGGPPAGPFGDSTITIDGKRIGDCTK
jgi:uncharacterized protein DUF3617